MKNLDVLLQQAGLRFLGFDPGPIDGVAGPRTETAKARYIASQVERSFPASVHLQRWHEATVKPGRLAEVERIVSRIIINRNSYEAVASVSRVPWFIIACLHNMESGGNFRKHLHEGSPLTGRTKDVPKGRPLAGAPPFTWAESAIDALAYDQLEKVNWDSLGDMLYACERYNGTGYLIYHPGTPSPYLWAGTGVERMGKYVKDGRFDPTAYSDQIGVVAILKGLENGGHIQSLAEHVS